MTSLRCFLKKAPRFRAGLIIQSTITRHQRFTKRNHSRWLQLVTVII